MSDRSKGSALADEDGNDLSAHDQIDRGDITQEDVDFIGELFNFSVFVDAPKKQGFTKTFFKKATTAERRLSKIGSRVNVQTKEDDKVCPKCDQIAVNGPYDLDTARGLIPAHPRCRCAFIPAEGDDQEDDE